MVTNNAANNATAATGKVLQGAGVGTASTYSTATYPSTATSTGTILRANGTNWVATTATYPTTAGTSGNVLTSDGTNWSSTAPSSASIGVEAIVNSSQTNATGDGTTFTVIWDGTVWQQGSGYNAGTGIFTVPTTGIYLVTYSLTLSGLSASFTSAEFKINGSAGVMTRKNFNPGVALVSGQLWFSDTVITSRTAGDTIYVAGQVSGSTKTISTVITSFGPFCYLSICRLG